MTLIAWPALMLALAVAVLIALAAWRAAPRKREVGTLMIWKRVAQAAASATERRRSFDWLLWVLIAAVVVSSLGAARPAVLKPPPKPRVAVFVERLDPVEFVGVEDVMDRASREIPKAELVFYTPAVEGAKLPDQFVRLVPGTLISELAQFRTVDADAFLMFLSQDTPGVEGRVLSRVTQRRGGVVFDITSVNNELIVRASAGQNVQVSGASESTHRTQGDVQVWRGEVNEDRVTVTGTKAEYRLVREPFIVGLGADWVTPAHRALHQALESEDAQEGQPDVWLGGRDQAPAIRIGNGEPVDLAGVELSYDPQHPLFADLPLSAFDWKTAGRVLPREDATRPLLTAIRDGEVVGDVIRLRANTLEFAGDPFSDSPMAAAALLLDNAIGVVTGEPPSRRRTLAPETPYALPTERAALATPFDPYGELDVRVREVEETVEFSTWLLVFAGALLVGVAFAVGRKG